MSVDKEVINEEKRKKIADAIFKLGAIEVCPRCGKKEFTLLDGIFSFTVQNNIKNNRLSGQALPTTAVMCDNCGYISFHALGKLGLLSDFKD